MLKQELVHGRGWLYKGIEKLLETKCGKGKDQCSWRDVRMLHLVYPVFLKLLKEEEKIEHEPAHGMEAMQISNDTINKTVDK